MDAGAPGGFFVDAGVIFSVTYHQTTAPDGGSRFPDGGLVTPYDAGYLTFIEGSGSEYGVIDGQVIDVSAIAPRVFAACGCTGLEPPDIQVQERNQIALLSASQAHGARLAGHLRSSLGGARRRHPSGGWRNHRSSGPERGVERSAGLRGDRGAGPGPEPRRRWVRSRSASPAPSVSRSRGGRCSNDRSPRGRSPVGRAGLGDGPGDRPERGVPLQLPPGGLRAASSGGARARAGRGAGAGRPGRAGGLRGPPGHRRLGADRGHRRPEGPGRDRARGGHPGHLRAGAEHALPRAGAGAGGDARARPTSSSASTRWTTPGTRTAGRSSSAPSRRWRTSRPARAWRERGSGYTRRCRGSARRRSSRPARGWAWTTR